VTYEPRRQEELDRIAALVRSGVGFDVKRGDQIEVANLRFADLTAMPETLSNDRSTAPLAFDDWFRFGQMVVLSLVILILLITVVRPTLKAAFSGSTPMRMVAVDKSSQAATEMVPAGAASAVGEAGLTDIPAVGTPMTRMIQAARQTGQVHARSMEQVGQLFSENPDGAITVLRQWINEPTDA
jgi:flagellar M-ring protein FliF